jgi:hypothetical protein
MVADVAKLDSRAEDLIHEPLSYRSFLRKDVDEDCHRSKLQAARCPRQSPISAKSSSLRRMSPAAMSRACAAVRTPVFRLAVPGRPVNLIEVNALHA